MTTIQFPAEQRDHLRTLVTQLLRPAEVEAGALVGVETWTWEPDLTVEEQSTLNDLLAMADSPLPSLAEWRAIRTELQALRSLRQMGRSAFMGLTAAERDRLTYDALVSQTIIDLALLRDE